MAKIILKEKLEQEGFLSCNIIVSSALIKNLEIYGFVNSCDREMIVSESNYNKTTNKLNGVVNRDYSNPIISSNYMYQVMDYFNGAAFMTTGLQTPIFKSLLMCSEETELNVENIWIPSLWANSYYQKIKSRVGTGVAVNEYEIKKAKMPSSITAKDGKAMLAVSTGAILMIDSSGEVASVGDDVLVVCRYINNQTGRLCYVIYGLDELFYDGL